MAIIEINQDHTYKEKVYASVDDLQNGRPPLHDFPTESWMVDPDCPGDRAPLFLVFHHSHGLMNKDNTSRATPVLLEDGGSSIDTDAEGVDLLIGFYEDGNWSTRITPRAGGGYEGLDRLKIATEKMRAVIASGIRAKPPGKS